MDQMRTALRGLAETAVTAPADDPASLWSQGRRRVRRRRLAAAGAVAAAVVAAGASSLVAVPAAVVHPAGATHEPAIPRNVWEARDWYPTTSEEGPPGVVAVLGGVIRGDRNGLFTVSATTGEYRLLDLPAAAAETSLTGTEYALAPDGRHIAYWIAGRPGGVPVVRDGESATRVQIGVGIYDTDDGSVEWVEFRTAHGIDGSGLMWADDDHLLVTYGERADSGSDPGSMVSVDVGTELVTVADAARRRAITIPEGGAGLTADGALTALPSRRRAVTVPLDGTAPRTLARLPRMRAFAPSSAWTSSEAIMLPGNRLLGGRNNYGADQTMVGSLAPDGTVGALRKVRGIAFVQPVAWLDDRDLLVIGDGRSSDEWGALYRLDTSDGAVTPLGTAQAGMYAPGLQFATDLLGAPMVEGERPPTVDSRWLRGGGAVLALLGSCAAILLWRRRRA
ncbi:hypothetical protein GCM10022215_40300 [Nocardioides fonticola]|uniref:WD40 repeat domain-containing protein n=1 Tax=Nocardioides fonticola TaxID=450363 RepID=A0ABP7Y006_9ACTN